MVRDAKEPGAKRWATIACEGSQGLGEDDARRVLCGLPAPQRVIAVAVDRCGVPSVEWGEFAPVKPRPLDDAVLVEITLSEVSLVGLAEKDWHRVVRHRT